MKNRIESTVCGLAIATVVLICQTSQAQLHNGVHTIALQSFNLLGQSMGLTYAPDFQLYYTGGGLHGWMVSDDINGNLYEAFLIDTDVRAWNYNANTGNLEMITGNAVQGNGVDSGYFQMFRDPQGLIDGFKVDIVPSLPGLNGPETCPFYDAQANVFYSATWHSNVVNVVSAVDGSLLSQINCTGAPAVTDNYGIGYDADQNWLLLYNSNLSGVMVFDSRTGQYIGLAKTDVAPTDGFGFAYANKQVWIFNPEIPGWQGYDIGANGGGHSYHLGISGACPGDLTLSWSAATPNAHQAVVLGNQSGALVIPPGNTCAGTILGLSGDVHQIGSVIGTGPAGTGSVHASAAAFACSHDLQFIETGSCSTSNVAQIP